MEISSLLLGVVAIVLVQPRLPVAANEKQELNHLNAILLDCGFSKHISNSMTGVGIAFSTSIVPIFLYFNGISINSDLWRILFLFQIIALSIFYIILKKKFSRFDESLL